MTSKQFVEKLKTWQSDKEYEKISRYFDADGKDNQIIGVRMKNIFDLAKDNTDMSLGEIEKLLDFLDRHAANMPRTMLRYATEKLNKEQKDYYRSL